MPKREPHTIRTKLTGLRLRLKRLIMLSGVAKLLRGGEMAYALESQAMHFVELGRAEIVSQNPLQVRFNTE